MPRAFRPLALALSLLLAAPAAAQENPFALASFAAEAPGTALTFLHARRLEEAPGAPERTVYEEPLALEVVLGDGGAREVRVRSPGGGAAEPPPYPAAAGHPILLLFLESTVRTMAAATGGSPDYIRSRLRERLWVDAVPEPVAIRHDGATLDGRRLAYRPFADDAHAADMGPFARLELRFVFSEAVPGRLVVAEAATPPAPEGLPGIRETIGLEGHALVD